MIHSQYAHKVTPKSGARYNLGLIALTAAVIIIYLFEASLFWKLTIDDAFISARYAQNAAEIGELVFNPGERVMGYTNPLLVLIEALVYQLGGDGLLAAKALGVVTGALTLLLTMVLGRQTGREWGWTGGLLAAGTMAVFPHLALNSASGLETNLYTSLLLGAVGLFIYNLRQENISLTSELAAGALLALACAARPEGLGVAAVLFGLQVLFLWKDRRLKQRPPQSSARRFAWLLAFGLLLAPLVIFLTIYYGSPVPNTFFAKTASGLVLQKYAIGLTYLVRWGFSMGLGIILIPLVLLLFNLPADRRPLGVISAVAVFYSLYIIYAGGDWMPGYRFIVPALPYFLIPIGLGLAVIWDAQKPRLAILSPLSQNLIGVILFLLLTSPALMEMGKAHMEAEARAAGYERAHRYVAHWLRSETEPGSTVALMDIGLIGFESERQIIDIAGLVDEEIARLMHADAGLISGSRPTASQIAAIVLARRPDVIVLAHENPPGDGPPTGWSHDEAIYRAPIFQAQYELIFSREAEPDSYYLSVYQRSADEAP